MTSRIVSSWHLVLAAALQLALGCGPKESSSPLSFDDGERGQDTLRQAKELDVDSPERVQALLAIAENELFSLKVRGDALDALEGSQDPRIVNRVIPLLSPSFSVLTFKAIIALGRIGNPAALPALRQLQNSDVDFIPGKCALALHDAIENCEKHRRAKALD